MSVWRSTATAGVLVIGLTVLGFVLGLLAPGLAGSTRPHPALSGGVGEAASIAGTNARVLCAPFALCALGLASSPFGRRTGDLAMLALVALNTILVGIALGRWRGGAPAIRPAAPSRMGSARPRHGRMADRAPRPDELATPGGSRRRDIAPGGLRGRPRDLVDTAQRTGT